MPLLSLKWYFTLDKFLLKKSSAKYNLKHFKLLLKLFHKAIEVKLKKIKTIFDQLVPLIPNFKKLAYLS